VPAGGSDVAEALWYVAPQCAEIRSERLPILRPGWVRVRTRFSGVSRGTEAIVFAGRVPESEYQRMRAPFMGGTFPYPVKYGYAAVGQVESGPEKLVGRTIFALHPHQTFFDVPAEAAILVPADIPAHRAVLAANMETALNAVWDAGMPLGRVAVVGAGVVGTLTGFLLRQIAKADVTLIDINADRAVVAAALGLDFSTPDSAPPNCDLVVHASASEAGLTTALDLAADEATVLELSWYGSQGIRVPLGGAFHSRRLKLVSSQVGKVAPSHRATRTPRQRLETALALLADARLDALFAPALRFAELPGRLGPILAPGSGVLCQLVEYS
jgi:threonine dehydrogenase-like Zn-dependent dehydrogenase